MQKHPISFILFFFVQKTRRRQWTMSILVFFSLLSLHFIKFIFPLFFHMLQFNVVFFAENTLVIFCRVTLFHFVLCTYSIHTFFGFDLILFFFSFTFYFGRKMEMHKIHPALFRLFGLWFIFWYGQKQFITLANG